MRIEEIRGGLGNRTGGSALADQMLVSVLLAGALICSVASALVEQHLWLGLAAVILLSLGLVIDRAEERRRWRS